MAKPVYILCAESGVEGKQHNLISIFNVLEKLTISVEITRERESSAPPTALIEPMRIWTIAVWMKEEGDEARQFESQFVVIRPDGSEIIKTELKTFGFGSGKYLYRMILQLRLGVTSFPEGFLRIQNRIREVGKTEWLSQEFPIEIETRTAQEATTRDAGAASEAPS